MTIDTGGGVWELTPNVHRYKGWERTYFPRHSFNFPIAYVLSNKMWFSWYKYFCVTYVVKKNHPQIWWEGGGNPSSRLLLGSVSGICCFDESYPFLFPGTEIVRINFALGEFSSASNLRPVRTENNWSPKDLGKWNDKPPLCWSHPKRTNTLLHRVL